jgi:hypothetical protein
MTHTPGPWETQAIEDEGEMRGCITIIGSNLGGLVGAAMPWPTELDSGDFSRVEDNAVLFAAAPDMLAALIQCQRVLADLSCPNGKPSGLTIQTAFAQCVEAEAAARKVIAKVEARAA